MTLQENKYYQYIDNEDGVFHTLTFGDTILEGKVIFAEFANSGQILAVMPYVPDNAVEECTIQEFIDVGKKYGVDMLGLYKQ